MERVDLDAGTRNGAVAAGEVQERLAPQIADGGNDPIGIDVDLGQLDIYFKSEYLTELPNHHVETISWRDLQNPYPLN